MKDLRIVINEKLAKNYDNNVFKIVSFLKEKHDIVIFPSGSKKLWEMYSDDYCAGFLYVDDHTLDGFIKWLNGEATVL